MCYVLSQLPAVTEQRHCLILIFITKHNCPECWLERGDPVLTSLGMLREWPWSGGAQPKAPGVAAGWVMALLCWIHTRVVHAHRRAKAQAGGHIQLSSSSRERSLSSMGDQEVAVSAAQPCRGSSLGFSS